MRYYFNIVTESEQISDPEGTELPTDEAAQAEAEIVASELMSEFPCRFLKPAVLEILTQEGRRIMALAIKHTAGSTRGNGTSAV